VNSADFSPDGRLILTANDAARLWDAHTGKPIRAFAEGGARDAAFSPDGRLIVTASADKTLRLWDVETGDPVGEPLKGHDRPCSLSRSVRTASVLPAGGTMTQ
jgi:WD40 repeat protein